MTAPRLMTERLILRMPVMSDLDAFIAFWATDRAKGMGGPHGADQAWFWFCHDVAQWHLLNVGGLTIERQSDGAVIGNVAISQGPVFPETELGYFLHDGFEGQGYMAEAARAMRDWAFGPRGLPTLVSYISPDNHASARVAEKLGAVIDPDAPGMFPGDRVYRHRRAA
ncbi:MAG: GNAT family N-acetyltransferase [Cereibacter sphaeroides]|uniref:GNAT family N-acetyltransferase n=1 Tax=Cereibacter sphaeroides TaxID=1063 RepID=A0A2W5S4H6_CERSP|nr:MAG: GNAT family N-acetyltransferase [Cereibacter sphaeroides]